MQLHKKVWELSVLIGLVYIAIGVILYLLGPSFMAQLSVGVIVFVVVLTLWVISGFVYRKTIGGYITFKQAFLAVFVIAAISSIFNTGFTIILYHLVDTELAGQIEQAVIENTINYMQSFNVPQEKIDVEIEKLQNMSARFTVGSLIMQYVYGLIFSAVVSLIIAAVIKKKNPDPFAELKS